MIVRFGISAPKLWKYEIFRLWHFFCWPVSRHLVHTPSLPNNGGINEPAPLQLRSLYYETELIIGGISFALRKVGLFFTIMFLIIFAILFSNSLFLVLLTGHYWERLALWTKSRTFVISCGRNRQYFLTMR